MEEGGRGRENRGWRMEGGERREEGEGREEERGERMEEGGRRRALLAYPLSLMGGGAAGSLPETVHSVLTLASVETGGAVTFVHVQFAVVAGEADGAVADVPTRLVLARASVQTGVGETLIDVQLTAGPCGGGGVVTR